MLRTRFLALAAILLLPFAPAPARAEPAAEVAAPSVVATVRGLAATDLLNIRATASPFGLVLGRLPNGTEVRRFECGNFKGYDWCKIVALDADGLTGWTPARYLFVSEEDAAAAREAAGNANLPADTTEEAPAEEATLASADNEPGRDTADEVPPATEEKNAGGKPVDAASGSILVSALEARLATDGALAFHGRREREKLEAAETALLVAMAAPGNPLAGAVFTPGDETVAPAPVPDPEATLSADLVVLPSPSPRRPAAPIEAPQPAEEPAAGESAPAEDAVATAPVEDTEDPAKSAPQIMALAAAAELPAPQPDTPSGPVAGDLVPAEETAAGGLPILSAAPPPEIDPVVVGKADPSPVVYDDIAEVPCARYFGQPMTTCKVGIVRRGDGAADVTVLWFDGGARTIRFRDGKPQGSDARAELRYSREATLNMIRVGEYERFEIRDDVAFGG
ncbi:SH3 domain-containing protein [Nitratireductor mangrovi]|uniref:SH3 domain-containing protein n=1 Tax=Nitratireductor mangrovi TaxID=2599600 RepID=A0A5B8L6J6_9HYPH|nr:SH3 domain-containing protein [Nitratireductor mangrovi]QDZ03048.1 SH3 domain-containing protein [Nitratireductor mangrovi]